MRPPSAVLIWANRGLIPPPPVFLKLLTCISKYSSSNHYPVLLKSYQFCLVVARAVLRDPDSNPYSLLEGEGEQADSDLSEGMGDRRRRSRRRRNDQEPSVMDAAAESDGQSGPNENGLGEAAL